MSDVPPTHIPTIDDLRVKLCYICREEESADAPPDPDLPAQRWVHPCKCTLIAHEDCLLQWIRSAQSSRQQQAKALKCPQCGSTYELVSERPLALTFFRLANTVGSLAGTLSLLAAGTGIIAGFSFSAFFRSLPSPLSKAFMLEIALYAATTSYGAHAVRTFVGKEVYDLVLGNEVEQWPTLAFLHLPAITTSLLFANFSPTMGEGTPLLLLALTPNLLAPRRLYTLRTPSPSTSWSVLGPAWPPSPFALALAFPIIRKGYKHLWKFAAARALGISSPGSRSHAALAAAAAAPAHGEDEGPEFARVQIENEAANAENAAAAIRTVAISASLGKRVAGGLLMPAVAAACGAALLRLSRHSDLLRTILAPREHKFTATALGLGKVAGALGVHPEKAGRWTEFFTKLIWGETRIWTECDPVWWRNTLGLGIFLVARDMLKLWHVWLAKRELETRRIKSRPFTGINPAELDLKEEIKAPDSLTAQEPIEAPAADAQSVPEETVEDQIRRLQAIPPIPRE